MRTDGKIGMNGPDTSGGSSAFGYYGGGMKRMSQPKYNGRFLGKRHAKKIGVLIVFVTAIVTVSALALAPSAKESLATVSKVPPPPFPLQGITVDEGGNPLFGSALTITNLRSGAINYSTSVDMGGYAYFEFNLNDMDGGIWDGDVIRVVATNTGVEGQSEGTVSNATGFLVMTITLYPVVIPEFPMVLVPVMGLMALVVVVNLKRRL